MTTKEAISRSGISPKLIRAVIRQLGGSDSLEDIRNHGIDSGFPGFTYYIDTLSFFRRHRAEIVSLVESLASDLGEPAAEMVASFGCLAGHGVHRLSEHEKRRKLAEYLPSVYRCLGGGRLIEEDTQVANALTWFVAEEVARAFED